MSRLRVMRLGFLLLLLICFLVWAPLDLSIEFDNVS
jgi:hypothetical protein